MGVWHARSVFEDQVSVLSGVASSVIFSKEPVCVGNRKVSIKCSAAGSEYITLCANN